MSLSLIRRLAACLVAAVAGGGLVACDRASQAPANDTAATVEPSEPVPPGAEPAPPVGTNGWRLDEAGPGLVVPAASALRAQLVYPQFTDSTLTTAARFALADFGGATLDLFGPAGLVGRATLADPEPPTPRAPAGAPPGTPETCTAWPRARLVPATEPLQPWTVAFAAGRAEAIPLDSAAALAPADSARLAAEVARIASSAPETRADSTSPFRGLPFVVREMRRFAPAPGVQAVAADVERRVNQEASQRVEHVLLVAERRATGPWRAAFLERTAGAEETLELNTVLAAVLLGAERRPTLVVGRDYGDGTAYALVERLGDARWAVRWSSAYAGC